jgi:hypothetical protein
MWCAVEHPVGDRRLGADQRRPRGDTAHRRSYEGIAAASRLATLLPEIGAQVAKSNDKQSHQFRLTLQRPSGASGDLGQIGLSVRSGLRAAGLSRDGRLP